MTDSFTIHSEYRLSDYTICQQLEDETLLMNAITGDTFGLDAFSAQIWSLMQTESNMATVADLIAPLLDVERSQLESDLLSFAQQLISRGLLEH